MHRSGGARMWTWLGALAGSLLATGLGCGGGRVTEAACDGGACTDSGSGSGSSSGGFPFTGPSCTTGPTFNTACWQCVRASCPATESCLTTVCGDFFTCFCGCAAGDLGCQQGCDGEETQACETCAVSVTNCQKASCHSVCEVGDGG
jgi:hypothetical protein